MDWTVKVLGPVQLETPDGCASIGGQKARALLAALVIGVGHYLSHDYLIEAMWGSDAPPNADGALQTHISKLRHLLGPEAILMVEHSYLLVAECEQIDACVFSRTVRRAGEQLAVDAAAARALVHEAMDLWRGVPFGDLADCEFCSLEMQRLVEVRRMAEEIELEASLVLGLWAETVPRLQAAVADEPYREHRWFLLMHALAQTGRRVEALRVHHDLEQTLGDVGLGVTGAFGELAALIAAGEPLPALAGTWCAQSSEGRQAAHRASATMSPTRSSRK